MEKPKLSMIELFSGIGAQKRGIDNTNLYDLDVVATSDIDKEAVVEYAAIHHGLTNEMVDNYAEYPSREQMIEELNARNIGMDFDKDKMYDWNKLLKKKNKELEKYWLAMHLQNNLGDISKINQLPTADCWFYSSPCQCFSVAGKQDGIDATCNTCGQKFNPMDYDVEHRYICPHCGSDDVKGTRSGLLLEVERLLIKSIETNTQPKYLCLENVKNLVGKSFKPDFDAWVTRLDHLGYSTYWKVLNAKECGVPQNRERVFAFSIRKDIDNGTFTFPLPFDTGVRLKDILETNVDERYYINTDRASNLIKQLVDKGQLKGQRACCDSTINDPNTREISNAIIARYDAGIQNHKQTGLAVAEPSNQPILVKNQGTEYVKDLDDSVTLKARDWKGWDNYGSTAVVEQSEAKSTRIGGLWDGETKHQAGSLWDTDGVAPTLDTAQGGGRTPHIIADNNIIWKEIDNFPYEISEYGEIRNKDGYIKSLRKDKYGYLRTELYSNGVQKTVCVHQLVAKYFLPKAKCMDCVNHKDGNILNNHYTNLEWCSTQENTKHKDEVLLHISGKFEEPKGVAWNKEKQKWESSIKYHNKTQYLGRYDNKSDAYRASYYGFINLRGYMPWDENKYKTFLKDGEVLDDFNQSDLREINIQNYACKETTEDKSQTIWKDINSQYKISNKGTVADIINKCKVEAVDGKVELEVKGKKGIVSIDKLIKKYFSDKEMPQFVIESTQKNAFVGDGSISSALTSAMGMGGGHVPMIGFENETNKNYKTDTVAIKQATKDGYIECDVPGVADLSYPNSTTRRGRVQDHGQTCPTITATETGVHYIENIYRIRKLTVRECFKLMGFEFSDWDKCEAIGISNSAGYKAAGNSIVTNCISLLFEHLFQSQFDSTYKCTDENFQKPQVD